MNLHCFEHQTGPQPRATIIVLHGLGADGHDFEPLVDELGLDAVGPLRFVFPNAPARPVTINGGYVMRAWYDILGSDLQRREDEAGLRESQAAIEALLTSERERGIPSERTVLAGFSQGAAMTLLTGLRHAHRLAGLVALSGYLPLADTLQKGAAKANRRTPVFMAHGSLDPVVGHALGLMSKGYLENLGYTVDWHSYAMPHSVSAEEIEALSRWLGTLFRR